MRALYAHEEKTAFLLSVLGCLLSYLFCLNFDVLCQVQSLGEAYNKHAFSDFSRVITLSACISKTSIPVPRRDIFQLNTSWMTSREILSTSWTTTIPTCCLWTTVVMDTPRWKPSSGISWKSTSLSAPVKVSSWGPRGQP